VVIDTQAREVYIGQGGKSAAPVIVLDTKGNFLRSFGSGVISAGQPHGLGIRAFDGKTTVWATDQGDHTIKLFSTQGDLLSHLGTQGQKGSGLNPLQFDAVTNVAFGASGAVYISDGEGGLNNRLIRMNPHMTGVVFAVGGKGTGAGQFQDPHSVCYDPVYDRTFVADRENNRTQVFGNTGAFVGEFTRGSGCYPMAPWSSAVVDGKTLFTITGNSDSESAPFYGTLNIIPLRQTSSSLGTCDPASVDRVTVGKLDQRPHSVAYDSVDNNLYVSVLNPGNFYRLKKS
jgi:hypothetical protein